jgi:hypothetical protein
MITPDQLETIVDHYLIALLWTMPGDDDNENPGDSLSIHCDLGEGVLAIAERDCAAFVAACGPLFTEAMQRDGYDLERFGHDFALTRNGHGAGFWDRNELHADELGRKLSSLCGWNRDQRTAFIENNLYLGDDGKAYFERVLP